MTPDQFREASQAIAAYRWSLAGALSSTPAGESKEFKVYMRRLTVLQDALADAGVKALATPE